MVEGGVFEVKTPGFLYIALSSESRYALNRATSFNSFYLGCLMFKREAPQAAGLVLGVLV